MSVDLDLYLAGVHAGTIRHRAVGGEIVPEFTYTHQWLGIEGAFPLSLSMPLQECPHNSKKTKRYLEALLPENIWTLEDWQKRDWQKRYRGMDIADPTSILAVVGEDVAGAARFVPAGKNSWVPAQHRLHR